MYKTFIFLLSLLVLNSPIALALKTTKTAQKPLTTSNNLKVIRPNCSIKPGIFNSNSYETTPKKAVASLTLLQESDIKYIKYESNSKTILKCDMHPFVQAVHWAYSYHLPLYITPDMIWYLIASGVSLHINQNAELLRYTFVNHTGKKEIIVRRDDFTLDSDLNPWNQVIDQFCVNISKLTNNNVSNLITANFSTTNFYSKVVSQIVLMDSMSKYFTYKFQTMCGIPEIKVNGTKKDWQGIQAKMRQLLNLMPGLSSWLASLEEIISHFIGLYDNKMDKSFWQQIYKRNDGSGGPYVTGWIISLFPYLGEDYQPNMYVFDSNLTWRNSTQELTFGLSTSSFPYHMNQVPFEWQIAKDGIEQELKMLFLGGFVGVSKSSSDQTLMPLFGYAVAFNSNFNKTFGFNE